MRESQQTIKYLRSDEKENRSIRDLALSWDHVPDAVIVCRTDGASFRFGTQKKTKDAEQENLETEQYRVSSHCRHVRIDILIGRGTSLYNGNLRAYVCVCVREKSGDVTDETTTTP